MDPIDLAIRCIKELTPDQLEPVRELAYDVIATRLCEGLPDTYLDDIQLPAPSITAPQYICNQAENCVLQCPHREPHDLIPTLVEAGEADNHSCATQCGTNSHACCVPVS